MLSRRRFLLAGAGAGAVGATAVASGAAPVTSLLSRSRVEAAVPDATTSVPFHGPTQASILRPPALSAAVAAFDVIADGAGGLHDLLVTLTDRIRFLMAGGRPPEPTSPAPPPDSGVLGSVVPVGGLSVTVGVGASLFDDRFGLASRKPVKLTAMPTFLDDDLRSELCHGDVSLVIQGAANDVVHHTLRDITRHTRGGMQPRWKLDGFTSAARPDGNPRNLLGFKDGTANPDVRSASVMDRLVWVQPGSGEPEWAAGGSYQVIRIIRMLVEFWDRVSLREQETMIGRRRDTGAPLDGLRETDTPRYADDPNGDTTPLDAHIRLANPRTAETDVTRILRRGFNYDQGLDANGNLDVGLLFTCYQQDVARQFAAVQTRLAGEPLIDYISPIGGGYFFVLPGVADVRESFASRLLPS